MFSHIPLFLNVLLHALSIEPHIHKDIEKYIHVINDYNVMTKENNE